MRIVRISMGVLFCALYIPAALALNSTGSTTTPPPPASKSADPPAAADAAGKNADTKSASATCTVKPDATSPGASAAGAKSGDASATTNKAVKTNKSANQQKSKPQPVKKQSNSDLNNAGDKPAPTSHVFTVNLLPGTGKACDVAHALVNAIPGILMITAIDDSRLLVTTDGSDKAEKAAATVLGADPKLSSQSKQYEDLVRATAHDIAAPSIAPSPHVDSFAQRLYYVHDPVAVAAIVNNAMPNVSAQPLLPDFVVLSNSADTDEAARQDAIRQARQMIAKIDQPHPQLAVDAWSMQLATDNLENLRHASEDIERTAADYDKAIDNSRQAGWRYLSNLVANPDNLDPLLRKYLSYSTRISDQSGAMVVNRVADSTKNDQALSASTETEPGYGLGYSKLYYPQNPNLMHLLVTLASLDKPLDYANPLLEKMECDDRNSTSCAAHASDKTLPCQMRDHNAYQPPGLKGDIPQPERLQLECLRDVMQNGLLAVNDKPVSTSSLGQFRAALADFLFQYKLMVEYPDSFNSFLEPMTADTLDSSFTPLVGAFEQDIAELQRTLFERCAQILKKDHITGYGYSGLVNVKVLGSQEAVVNTTAQNHFDVTPTASLSDLITNLGAQAASGTSFTSLFTGISPEKAVAIMTALGATLNPPKVSAQVGRDLDLDVTAHTLSGAYGAELDVTVKSIENGANLYKQGVTGSTDDLNSRVASHVVTTHVRVDSLRLLQLSTMSSVLARSQTPWKPFDPYIEIPILDLIVKRPRDAKEVFTRSLVFLDAMVVPTAADLGNGVPIIYDLAKTTGSSYKELHDLTLKRFFNEGLDRNLPQYHRAITDCLSREYLGMDGQVHVAIGPDGRSSGPSCQFKTDTSEKLMGSDSRSLIDPNPLRQDYYNTVE